MGMHPDSYVYYGVPLGTDDEREFPWESYGSYEWAEANLPEGLELGSGGYSEYPAYFLGVEELEVRAWEGNSRPLDLRAMNAAVEVGKWDVPLRKALDALGTPELADKIGWYTCASYG